MFFSQHTHTHTHTHTQNGAREGGQATGTKPFGLVVFQRGLPIPTLGCKFLQCGESHLLSLCIPVPSSIVSYTCRYLVRVIISSWFLGDYPNVNTKVLHPGNPLSSRPARMILVTLTIKEASFISASEDMLVG